MNLGLIGLLCAAAGLVFLGLAGSRLRQRRLARCGGHGMIGLLFVAVAVALLALAANFQTYRRLSYERDIAELRFRQLAADSYRVTVGYTDDGHPDGVYELRGDEWQIDARMLKWHGVANLLGLDSHYRLDRLSGRYASIGRERSEPRTVYALTENPGLDLWHLARRYERWLPWADASYGSATYLPMADGAEFVVSITQVGVIARPGNEAALQVVSEWR